MRRLAVVALAVVASFGIAACGDDEAPTAVSQDDYDDAVERLCNQHGPTLLRAYTETRPDSDAEEAAFYTAEVIPRARAMVNRLARLGFPPDRDADYRAGLNEALVALGDLEASPYRYIDERHRGVLAPEDDHLVRLREAFAAADVACEPPAPAPTSSTVPAAGATP